MEIVDAVAADWLARIATEGAHRAGIILDERALAQMSISGADDLTTAMRQLLSTDVDDQRTNPLSLFRAAVTGPTKLLASAGVPIPPSDPFAQRAFPDDPYRLGPATWSDVDQRLHEPGLRWGAWKAMTVMRRHRGEDDSIS